MAGPKSGQPLREAPEVDWAFGKNNSRYSQIFKAPFLLKNVKADGLKTRKRGRGSNNLDLKASRDDE